MDSLTDFKPDTLTDIELVQARVAQYFADKADFDHHFQDGEEVPSLVLFQRYREITELLILAVDVRRNECVGADDPMAFRSGAERISGIDNRTMYLMGPEDLKQYSIGLPLEDDGFARVFQSPDSTFMIPKVMIEIIEGSSDEAPKVYEFATREGSLNFLDDLLLQIAYGEIAEWNSDLNPVVPYELPNDVSVIRR